MKILKYSIKFLQKINTVHTFLLEYYQYQALEVIKFLTLFQLSNQALLKLLISHLGGIGVPGSYSVGHSVPGPTQMQFLNLIFSFHGAPKTQPAFSLSWLLCAHPFHSLALKKLIEV